MPEPIFTPEEANAALGGLRPLVEAMVDAKRVLDEAQEERDAAARSGSPGTAAEFRRPSSRRPTRPSRRRRRELATAIGQVQAQGVLVKDLDSGLVDFPAKRDGEDILLCWQLGEDEVAFWHGLEDGFAGRQPL